MRLYIISLSNSINGSESVKVFSKFEDAQKALREQYNYIVGNAYHIRKAHMDDDGYSIDYEDGGWVDAQIFDAKVD